MKNKTNWLLTICSLTVIQSDVISISFKNSILFHSLSVCLITKTNWLEIVNLFPSKDTIWSRLCPNKSIKWWTWTNWRYYLAAFNHLRKLNDRSKEENEKHCYNTATNIRLSPCCIHILCGISFCSPACFSYFPFIFRCKPNWWLRRCSKSRKHVQLIIIDFFRLIKR